MKFSLAFSLLSIANASSRSYAHTQRLRLTNNISVLSGVQNEFDERHEKEPEQHDVPDLASTNPNGCNGTTQYHYANMKPDEKGVFGETSSVQTNLDFRYEIIVSPEASKENDINRIISDLDVFMIKKLAFTYFLDQVEIGAIGSDPCPEYSIEGKQQIDESLAIGVQSIPHDRINDELCTEERVTNEACAPVKGGWVIHLDENVSSDEINKVRDDFKTHIIKNIADGVYLEANDQIEVIIYVESEIKWNYGAAGGMTIMEKKTKKRSNLFYIIVGACITAALVVSTLLMSRKRSRQHDEVEVDKHLALDGGEGAPTFDDEAFDDEGLEDETKK